MTKGHRNQLIETKRYYDSLGRVFCPILNCYVHFNSDGYRHLIYKTNRKKRNVKEQQYKLRFIKLIIPVLKHSSQLADWRFADGKSDMQHYAVVYTVGKNPIKVRVIVKRTGDGQFNFHSVMGHENNKKPRHKRGS